MGKYCFLLVICLAFFSNHCALDVKGYLSGKDAQDARPEQAEDQGDIFIDWAPDTYPDTPEDPRLDVPVDLSWTAWKWKISK